MGSEVADEHPEASDDDEEVEQDDEFQQERHARHQDLRAESDAALDHQEPQDLAERLMPHRQHQEADQIHRQHYSEGRHHRLLQSQSVGETDRYGEREHDEKRAYDEPGGRLDDFVDLLIDIEVANDAPDEIRCR
jgi:hypothetical protein